jgi:hypothetical protein
MLRILRFSALAASCVIFVTGCTSLGQQGRAAPLIAKPAPALTEIGFDSDDHELGIAIEKMLDARGVKVRILSEPEVREVSGNKEYIYREVQTRYVLRVRSSDYSMCVPEGSRQMDFAVTVTDYNERSRLLVMQGEHGCKDTLVREVSKWLDNGRS